MLNQVSRAGTHVLTIAINFHPARFLVLFCQLAANAECVLCDTVTCKERFILNAAEQHRKSGTIIPIPAGSLSRSRLFSLGPCILSCRPNSNKLAP
ncbi:hypothetical protein BJ741DRAFT_595114 [Chytriomyces cf. hyalinus JEL632]|nr:hypothetical protein BJ741DRAFT_595114 [Chytriomyces cf. hyalinus JEL632]